MQWSHNSIITFLCPLTASKILQNITKSCHISDSANKLWENLSLQHIMRSRLMSMILYTCCVFNRNEKKIVFLFVTCWTIFSVSVKSSIDIILSLITAENQKTNDNKIRKLNNKKRMLIFHQFLKTVPDTIVAWKAASAGHKEHKHCVLLIHVFLTEYI